MHTEWYVRLNWIGLSLTQYKWSSILPVLSVYTTKNRYDGIYESVNYTWSHS